MQAHFDVNNLLHNQNLFHMYHTSSQNFHRQTLHLSPMPYYEKQKKLPIHPHVGLVNLKSPDVYKRELKHNTSKANNRLKNIQQLFFYQSFLLLSIKAITSASFTSGNDS